MKRLMFFIFLVLMPVASSLVLYDVDCYNDGRIEITLEGNNESKAYTNEIIVKTSDNIVDGSWGSNFIQKSSVLSKKYGTFISKEGIFNEDRIYQLDVSYVLVENATARYDQSLSFTVNCPGLLFACNLMNLSISECYTQNSKFNALLDIQGLRQSGPTLMDPAEVINYKIKAENDYLGLNTVISKEGVLPKYYKITYLKNNQYMLEFNFPDNKVNSLFVEFNDNLFAPCSREKYSNVKFYDFKECTAKESQSNEEEIIEMPLKETTETLSQEPTKQKETNQWQKNQESIEESSEISAKSMLMIAAIVILLGVIVIYLLKKRDITS